MTELPIVVNMTVDASRTEYDLTAESNLEEIELLNDTVIETGGAHVPVYQGPYTVDAGLTAVTLDTDGKRMTQDVTVNALQENDITGNSLTINTSTGKVSSLVSISRGYSPSVFGVTNSMQLSTQARATITPTASEQTAVARNKYTLGAVKVRAISSPYADVSGVTATAGDVLSGKYFVDSSGVLTLGTATAGGGDGAPMPVDTVAEMIDTTKVYLYVGSETGYTFGDWYYYNGTAWVSGGKWGADGGVNTNARNLLQYILDRATYTEPGMDIYVNALYEALAQAGAVTTTYTITNALSHVTNSNSATGADSGDSYTGTLTADANYTIDTVTVTMGGTDITSTAYTSGTGVISIASVTGNIVITASAVIPNLMFAIGYIKSADGTVATSAGANACCTDYIPYDATNPTIRCDGILNDVVTECNFYLVPYDVNKTYKSGYTPFDNYINPNTGFNHSGWANPKTNYTLSYNSTVKYVRMTVRGTGSTAPTITNVGGSVTVSGVTYTMEFNS